MHLRPRSMSFHTPMEILGSKFLIARLARYRIKFYESDQRFLFELKNLPAPSFQLDKINFLHAGWFLFELYEDSRLIEKHKVYLDKP